MNNHSPTTFLHFILKVFVVHGHDLAEHFSLYVSNRVLKNVAINEAALRRVVSMQIKIEHDAR
jgi:hypothetical protein